MVRPRFMVGLLLISFVVVAGLLAAAHLPFGTETPNVILISIDTCRADHLGCYGHAGQPTPNVDAVAQDGVLFSNAFSPAPKTLPAHCSMLTGTYPPYHGVRDNANFRLGDSSITLAELLRERGYRTGAAVGTAVLDSRTGVGQGFDTYDDRMMAGSPQTPGREERRGDQVSRVAEAWLEANASEPFFLFLNYFDAHDPYEPPEPFAGRFADDPYSGEIAFADQCIGRVLNKLRDLNLYESSLIIITGDHGEGLGEHGESKHGYYIYNSTTNVPMIFKIPGRSSGRQVDRVVSITDIVPTVLALLDLPAPSGVQGEDLSSFLLHDATEREGRVVYSEAMEATKFGCSALWGAQTLAWKYIQAPRPELYNLTADPNEQNNVVDVYPDRARALRARLRQIMQEQSRSDRTENILAPDPDSLARLRSLGYTGEPVDEEFELDSEKEDPKDFIKVYEKLEIIEDCMKRGDHAGARQVGEEALAMRPDLVRLHDILGRIAIKEGNIESGIRHYTEALRLDPESPQAVSWYHNLGTLMARGRRLDEAAEYYRAAIRKFRRDAGGSHNRDHLGRSARSLLFSLHYSLANTLLNQGKFDEAVSEYREALSINPNDAQAHYERGVASYKLGRISEAVAAFRAALRLAPDHGRARQALEAITHRHG